MKHLIKFWPVDWVNQTEKKMKRLVRRIVLRWMGEGSGWFILSEGKSYGNVLVAFYQKLPMGRKDKIFGVKYQNLLVTRQLLNYKDMFVVTPI